MFTSAKIKTKPNGFLPANMAVAPAEPWKPHPYQKRSVQFLLKQNAAGLFLDPGLGKTSIVLKAFNVLLAERLARRGLIIAPLRVCYEVWPVEVEKWLEFNNIRIAILHGSRKDDMLYADADLFVINPEGLPWLMSNRRFRELQPDSLIVDESSLFRHTNTQRFKLLKPTLAGFRRRWILTGSPSPHGYLDLFGQIYILDLGRALGQYITHYKMNYFFPTGPKEWGGNPWVLKEGGERAIQKAIKPLILRLDAEDYLQIPPVVNNVIRVTLPEKVQHIYNDLEEEMFAELDERGNSVTAVNTAVASMKCCQVANGGIYYEPFKPIVGGADYKRKMMFLHDEKIQALHDIVEELQGEPLLVNYEYNHDLIQLQKNFPGIPYVGGGQTLTVAGQILRKWNSNQLTMLFVHPKSAARGLNIQYGNCAHVAFFNIPWDYELYDQLIRRIRRQGNRAKRIIVHHIVARNTIDEGKMRALKSKAHTQSSLLDALRSYRRNK